jgi:hypothetical protein
MQDPSPSFPRPPAGWNSWLDFVVDTFDGEVAGMERQMLEGILGHREVMRDAARRELQALRERAERAPPR